MLPGTRRYCLSCRHEAELVPELVSGAAGRPGGRRIKGRLVGLLLFATLQSAACTALVVGGAGQPRTYPQEQADEARAADERISNSVRSLLAGEAELRQAKIEVATQDGVVTLNGRVADYRVRSQAELLAASVGGVRGINNRLAVAAKR